MGFRGLLKDREKTLDPPAASFYNEAAAFYNEAALQQVLQCGLQRGSVFHTGSIGRVSRKQLLVVNVGFLILCLLFRPWLTVCPTEKLQNYSLLMPWCI